MATSRGLVRVFEHADPDALAVRSHPWRGSLANPAHRHHDLRREPGLIRTALEDFVGWSHYPSTQTFYGLLEWLNGGGSRLETSDCAFSGPAPNDTAGFDKDLVCSGRLMLLFRDLANNSEASVHGLTDRVARGLAGGEVDFEWGVFGATVVPVRFLTLPRGTQLGSQLMLSFWAWGDDESEVMAHLDRSLHHLAAVVRTV